jgi:hypothetical protein
MRPSLSIHLRLSAVAIALALLAGCSSSPDAPGGGSGGGGAPGSGGAPATGGQSAGGAPGSGGGGGAGAGGAGGAGGMAAGGSGGTATGGSAATGGRPGTGGGGTSTGGAPGSGGQGGGAGPDASNDRAPDAITMDPPTGPSLDACFVGLRALSGASQLATKRSADGKIEARIALEVDGFGTSGTKAWRLVRIAVLTPDAKVCWNDENALRTAYKGSHHNCSDVVTVSSGGRTYEFKAPDTDPKRGDTTLTILTGASAGPANKLTTSSCKGGSPTASCTSGGPC